MTVIKLWSYDDLEPRSQESEGFSGIGFVVNAATRDRPIFHLILYEILVRSLHANKFS